MMHSWDDRSVDWKGLNEAAFFIGRRLEEAGVFVSDAKEKWGTVRVYCDLEPVHAEPYMLAYLAAVEKWPHLRQEILIGADYPEFLPFHPDNNPKEAG